MNSNSFDFPSHEEFNEVVPAPVYAGFRASAFTTGQFSIQDLANDKITKSTVHIACSSNLDVRAIANVHIAISSMI